MAGSILARLAVLISGDTSGLNKSVSQAEKSLGGFSKSVKGISGQLTAAIGAISFVALGKQILDVTAEFQKFEAVLTNTLGSKSEAQDALERIRDFAAKTPFAVSELTASFVKLANQGFKPTTDELRKLGDLASSTGKGFDQLTEAIIDAQVGEFERLKEFGIRASKQGDQVKFTFKGVETQTKFTADSIRDYILTLGDLEGVSGSMAAISETLGGKISNLGDAWDNFLLTLGTQTSGVAFDILALLQSGIDGATDALTDDKIFTRLDTVKDLYVEQANSIEEVTANLAKLNNLIEVEKKNQQEATTAKADTIEEMKALEERYISAREFVDAYGIAIGLLTKKLEDLQKATTANAAPTLSIIQQINADIKHFEDLKIKSFSIEEIGRFNNKLKELRDELELINLAGSESGFLKNLNANQAAGLGTDIPTPSVTDPNNLLPTVIDVDTSPYLEKIAELDQVNADFHVSEEERNKAAQLRFDILTQKQIEQANAAAEYGSIVGDAFGQAAAGQISFVQAAKQATAQLVKTLLARALAGIIASAATSGGPPPVAIALAAAGVAAISAMFAKIGASGGGGGSASTGAARATRSASSFGSTGGESRVDLSGKFRVDGRDLVLALENNSIFNKRVG